MIPLALPRVAALAHHDILAQRAFILLVAAAVTGVVVYYGWISDDAYITARYAYNLIHGYGPVFNPGERVQGYSHPLWLLLFSAGLALLREPVLVSVALGAVFTLLTMLLVGRTLLRTPLPPLVSAGLFAAFATLLTLSEAWRSFQTSGLENSLTNLLIALLAIDLCQDRRRRSDVLRPALYSGLLVLTRPDLALLVAPLAGLLLVDALRDHRTRQLLLGFAPLVAWLAFAQFYYGTPIANTVTDKIGIFTPWQGIVHGLHYLFDFTYNEPGTTLALVVLTLFVACSRLGLAAKLLLAGVCLYTIALVPAGGDFMRGRLLTPVLFCVALLSLLATADYLRAGNPRRPVRLAAMSLAGAFLVLQVIAPRQDRLVRHGIVNERVFYDGQSLRGYLDDGSSAMTDSNVIAELQQFEARCGPITVDAAKLGAFSYLLGPKIQVIDVLGLTDSTIAGLPRSTLTGEPRPGHPARRLPVSYLAGRGDIKLFSNWQGAVAAGDCGIISAVGSLTGSTASVSSDPASRPIYKPQP